ncbi:MAG TPA: hypothetical protein ENK18_05915 [Deltaproteobacteria bacterium]|nr:hypothetical protein [Deltaproteobacteria bacterium]
MVIRVVIWVVGWSGVALAGDRDPLPARWIERPLVLPRGWARAEVALALRGPGPAAPLLQGEEIQRDVVAATLGLGVLPRVEAFAVLPWVWTRSGTRSGRGLGDPVLGSRLVLHRSEPPSRSVALELSATTPRGGIQQGLPLDVGVTVLRGALGGRAALGGLGLEGWLGPSLWLPGPVGWLRPAGGGHGRIDPGDGGVASVAAWLQAGPLVPRIAARIEARAADRIGARPVSSASVGAELEGTVRAQLSRGVWGLAGYSWPLIEAVALPGRPRGRALQLAVGVAL